MLEFREYHIAGDKVIDVWLKTQYVDRSMGKIRHILNGPYWFEAAAVCIEQEELEMILNKIKELNRA